MDSEDREIRTVPSAGLHGGVGDVGGERAVAIVVGEVHEDLETFEEFARVVGEEPAKKVVSSLYIARRTVDRTKSSYQP